MADKVPTPNLDKMLAVKEEAGVVQQFIDWFCDEYQPNQMNYGLDAHTDERIREKIMARYFGVDLDACERERMALLDSLRDTHRQERIIKRRKARA